MEFWERFEIWCCLKHFLKAEGNGKETLEKAYREQGDFTPEGGTMRNFLTAVENVECAVGHFEEFAIKSYEGYIKAKEAGDEEEMKNFQNKYSFYCEMTDSTRLVRQEMIKSPGHPPEKFLESLDMLETLMDRLIDFMKGEPIEDIMEGKLIGSRED